MHCGQRCRSDIALQKHVYLVTFISLLNHGVSGPGTAFPHNSISDFIRPPKHSNTSFPSVCNINHDRGCFFTHETMQQEPMDLPRPITYTKFILWEFDMMKPNAMMLVYYDATQYFRFVNWSITYRNLPVAYSGSRTLEFHSELHNKSHQVLQSRLRNTIRLKTSLTTYKRVDLFYDSERVIAFRMPQTAFHSHYFSECRIFDKLKIPLTNRTNLGALPHDDLAVLAGCDKEGSLAGC
ncbi:hypothetical protein ABKN59_009624 [Abortiporus biennis]